MPVAQASAHANSAQATIMPAVPSAAAPSQRGAARRNWREKRTPRLMPMTSCAALVSAVGTLDQCTPAMASAMAASSAPMNHGLARPVRRIAMAPRPVTSSSHSRPGHSAARAVGGVMSSACRPQCCLAHCMANGMLSTTTAMRSLCAAATRSVRAPARSASSVISDAPPMAPAK